MTLVAISVIRRHLQEQRGYEAWKLAISSAASILDLLDPTLGIPHSRSRSKADGARLAQLITDVAEKLARFHYEPGARPEDVAARLQRERIPVRALAESSTGGKRSLDYPGIIRIAHLATLLLAAACGHVVHGHAKTFRSRDTAEASHPWQHFLDEGSTGPLLSLGLEIELSCGAWLVLPPVPHMPESAAFEAAEGAALRRVRHDINTSLAAFTPGEAQRRREEYLHIALERMTGRTLSSVATADFPHRVLATRVDVIAEAFGLPARIAERVGLANLFENVPFTGGWLVDPDGELPRLAAEDGPLASWDLDALEALVNTKLGIPLLDMHRAWPGHYWESRGRLALLLTDRHIVAGPSILAMRRWVDDPVAASLHRRHRAARRSASSPVRNL
jgi:hypothetical protein